MRPRRRKHTKNLESSDSDDEIAAKKMQVASEVSHIKRNEDTSSSESDIENYLQRVDKIDLNSSFFTLHKPPTHSEPEFDKIEYNIFDGVTRLSDSDSDCERLHDEKEKELKEEQENGFQNESEANISSRLSFQELREYTDKIEAARKHIEQYKARKQAEENKDDILNILTTGEAKTGLENIITPADLHSSDFESCDSEREDWEEIQIGSQEQKEKSIVPKESLQITVNMPDAVRKKKGIDLLAAMKRRLNRIRKENQVLVHKVHVLCWIAHGNYVNSAINCPSVLAMALSLLPSEHCYPPERTDLSYLEQIVNWYKKTVKSIEKPLPKKLNLDKALELQISKKEAYNKKMLLYIFIAMLRSLGIQCRLILSFQVEPLRPPANELHSLSTKSTGPTGTDKNKVNGKKENTAFKKINVSAIKSVQDVKKTGNLHEEKHESRVKDKKKTNSNNLKSSSVKNKHKGDNFESKPLSKSQKIEMGNDKLQDNGKNMDEKKKLKVSLKKLKLHKNNMTKSSKEEQSDMKQQDKLLVPQSDRRTRSAETSKSQKSTSKSRSKSAISKCQTDNSTNTHRKNRRQVTQLDGPNDLSSEDETGTIDGPKSKIKPNLKKLKAATKPSCSVKNHPKRYINNEDSESEFQCRPSKTNKLEGLKPTKTQKINFHKLKKSVPTNTVSSKEISYLPPSRQMDIRNDIISLIKGRIVEQKHKDRSRIVKKRKTDPDSDSDSDYAPEPIKKKYHDSEDEFVPKTKVKRRIQVPGKNIISDSEKQSAKKKKGIDVWVEVFLESEEKWISVDVNYGQVHCVKELYQRATHPVSYVIAWNNNNSLKDVTKRYCQNFNTVTRKLRVDPKWWDETIKPYLGRRTARDKEEDDDLSRQQLDQPLPKSIAEYKNHPLYALKRHLLKFEAIYPSDAPTVGFIRNEAVYPRECVYTLHSRDIWLKSAKVVKPGEKPYKIVKARPKYDKLSNKIITDQMLEIFGTWQTEDYVPPTAENGIVPRNAFGNVELFKARMLPKGTVHLKLPGLNKIARRMNIDCASAIVGFDFHGGWSHPTYDGFVVCEEYAEQLIAAWELEQDEIEKREQEKIEKRVYTNWKRLIKGLLIRERLKARYDFGEPPKEVIKKKKGTRK